MKIAPADIAQIPQRTNHEHRNIVIMFQEDPTFLTIYSINFDFYSKKTRSDV